jgi:hypothetical protein
MSVDVEASAPPAPTEPLAVAVAEVEAAPTGGPDIPVKKKSKVVRKSNAVTKTKVEKSTKPSRKTRKDAKKD